MTMAKKTFPEDFDVKNLIKDLFEKPSRYGDVSAVELYDKIIKLIDENSDDLEKDSEFIKNVRKFFGITHRSSEFVREFCSLIVMVRNDYELFDIVKVSDRLAELSRSKYEISFASKIIHLADKKHEYIIYDANVRTCFDLQNIRSTPQAYKQLMDKIVDFKNKLQSDNKDRMCVECRNFLEMFDKELKNKKIVLSENKKIDFYLWRLGDCFRKINKK